MIGLTEAYDALTHWLGESHRPLILSHRRPDGDALGAMTALSRALRARGCEPLPTLFGAPPPRYGFLDPGAAWHDWEAQREILGEDCDGVIVVDTCALAQLEPAAQFLAGAPRTLVIDHHVTRDPLGTRAGDLRVFDETASATSLMIHEWARRANIALDAPLREALFVGIATDTGWFRFSNADARTLRAAADLLGDDLDGNRLYNLIYQQEPAAKLRLVSHVLSRMELHADGRLAVLFLRPADFEATGADDTMTEDLVNEPSRLGGVEATLLFTQEADDLVRVNFRSKSTLDVSELARRFGGGGHARAAGARLMGAWERNVPRVIAETIAAL